MAAPASGYSALSAELLGWLKEQLAPVLAPLPPSWIGAQLPQDPCLDLVLPRSSSTDRQKHLVRNLKEEFSLQQSNSPGNFSINTEGNGSSNILYRHLQNAAKLNSSLPNFKLSSFFFFPLVKLHFKRS